MTKKMDIRWKTLRKFILFGFADAAGLEDSKEQKKSVYELAQLEIVKTLGKAFSDLGEKSKKVILIAHSLGCQVISNYIWDAQKSPEDVKYGIWKKISGYESEIKDLTEEKKNFLRLNTLHRVYTTGCNIPIFVAAHARDQIIPIKKPNPDFKWFNFYDRDDVLGWPLSVLCKEYEALVKDFSVNAGNILNCWNPVSHNQYWNDNDFINPLVKDIEEAIDR